MYRTLVRLLGSILASLLLIGWCPSVWAQLQPRAMPEEAAQNEKSDHFQAVPYAIAGFTTLLILIILCRPARKTEEA